MRPLTISLDDFISSRHQEYVNYRPWFGLDVLDKKYTDAGTILDNIDEFALDYKNATGMEANGLIDFLSEDPVMPPLLLDCDGKNVLSINVNKSMTNRSETVLVNDRAKCMLTIKNTTTNYEPIW